MKNLEIKKVKQQDILNSKDRWPLYYNKKCLSDASYGRNVPKTQKVTFSMSKYNQFIHFSKPILKNIIKCSDFIYGLVSHNFSLRLPASNSREQNEIRHRSSLKTKS